MGMVYEFAGSWCRPDNIVVLVHYALTSLVFSITDLATIHGVATARRRVIGSDCQFRDFKISLFLACRVSIAVGFTEGAYRVLTGCVIVSEVVWIVPSAHRGSLASPMPIASLYASASRLLSSLLVIRSSFFYMSGRF